MANKIEATKKKMKITMENLSSTLVALTKLFACERAHRQKGIKLKSILNVPGNATEIYVA